MSPMSRQLILVCIVVVLVCTFNAMCTHASNALPTMIAAAPMEVAVVDALERRRRRKLQVQEMTFLETLTKVAGTSSPDDKSWPPPNTLLREQTAYCRQRVKLRDSDILIVSYPKVRKLCVPGTFLL